MTFGNYLEKIGDRTASYRAARMITGGEHALYPGSYLDTAPLAVWPNVTFVDNDRKFAKEVAGLSEPIPRATFLVADYREPLPGIQEGSADILISLYAGPISQYCSRYLRVGGYLLANNSHGDASLALLDPRYELAAVLPTWTSTRYLTAGLAPFARAKRSEAHTIDRVLASGRGVAFEKSAACYLFQLLSH